MKGFMVGGRAAATLATAALPIATIAARLRAFLGDLS